MVLVLVVVLGGGQQPGHVADAFGDTLPEKQLGAQPQVLGVLDEAEADHGALAGAQLILQRGTKAQLHGVGTRWRTERGPPTFP